MTASPLPAPVVYIITDRLATGGRPLLEVLAAALAGADSQRGSDGRLPVAVCVRDKDLPTAELTSLAKSVRALTKKFRAELFVNGRVDVALAAQADGVHLPTDGIAAEDVRAISRTARIAASTHTLDEVLLAARERLDFVVHGPVFATPSKQGVLTPRGLEGLRDVCGRGVPVLALGGIFPDHARLCREAGAAGVAVIRAVLASSDPAGQMVGFLAGYRQPK